MNFVILTLFFYSINSICYDYDYITINGTNIIPEGKTFGWLIFEPYNISYNCSTIVYQFKNITNKYYDNVIFFQFYGKHNLNDIKLFCENECNLTIDCKQFPFSAYYIDDSTEKFDYNIIITEEKINFQCTMQIIIYIIVVIIFIFAILVTIYQIRQWKMNKMLIKHLQDLI